MKTKKENKMSYTGKKFTNRLIAGVLVFLVLVALLLGGIFALTGGTHDGPDDVITLDITTEEGIDAENAPKTIEGVVPDYDDYNN